MIDLILSIQQVGLPVLLFIILYSSYNGWWVWGYEADARRDLDLAFRDEFRPRQSARKCSYCGSPRASGSCNACGAGRL